MGVSIVPVSHKYCATSYKQLVNFYCSSSYKWYGLCLDVIDAVAASTLRPFDKVVKWDDGREISIKCQRVKETVNYTEEEEKDKIYPDYEHILELRCYSCALVGCCTVVNISTKVGLFTPWR